MSNVKDTIEAYEIGFAKGFTAGTVNASELHTAELAILSVKKDQEVRAAYDSGFNAGLETGPWMMAGFGETGPWMMAGFGEGPAKKWGASNIKF